MSMARSTPPDDLHAGGDTPVNPTASDPIVDEVRAIREAYAGNDPEAIVADLCSRQAQHPQRLVSLASRPAQK